MCSEKPLSPFPGEQRQQPLNDTYNYHLPSFRIQIEITLRRLVRPLQVTMENAGKIFIFAARLYYFCATERLIASAFKEINDDISADLDILPDAIEKIEGNSMMRHILVRENFHAGLSPPAENRRIIKRVGSRASIIIILNLFFIYKHNDLKFRNYFRPSSMTSWVLRFTRAAMFPSISSLPVSSKTS